MRKLTKAHFNYLARKINRSFLIWEERYLENLDNNTPIINFSHLMFMTCTVNAHQTIEVQKHIKRIISDIHEECEDKEYKHFNHSFNCFMKRLCEKLKAQNPKFNESQFRKACTKGSIQ